MGHMSFVLGHGTLRVSGESYLSHFNLFTAELFQDFIPVHAETSQFLQNLAKKSALKRLSYIAVY